MSILLRPSTLSLLALALLAPAPKSYAVDPLDTFSIKLGGYVARFDTDVRADGETVTGSEIDLHRDLGLDDDNTLGFVDFSWRPWEHHEFGFGYHRNDSSNSRLLERDIIFNDTVYPTSATVRSEYEVETYNASYTWWAASHENWALGPRVGLVWYSMKLDLSLEIDVDGNPASGSLSRKVSADLPAPSIGGSWRWTPAEQWRISADIGYFTADIQDVDADVYSGRAGVEWYPWERFGFSLDYTINRIEADAEKNRFKGNMDFLDTGLRLGVAYRF